MTAVNVALIRDTKWLTLEVCREFQRGTCSRADTDCKFAHPPRVCHVENGRVVACFDSLKVSLIWLHIIWICRFLCFWGAMCFEMSKISNNAQVVRFVCYALRRNVDFVCLELRQSKAQATKTHLWKQILLKNSHSRIAVGVRDCSAAIIGFFCVFCRYWMQHRNPPTS